MLFRLQAAKLAINASVKFLENLATDSSIDEQQFADFIGLSRGATLCFVVDTADAMSDEIETIRTTTIDITRQAANETGLRKPSEYLLSPFNDPGTIKWPKCTSHR
jgi:hypothetical protein